MVTVYADFHLDKDTNSSSEVQHWILAGDEVITEQQQSLAKCFNMDSHFLGCR